MTLNLLEQGLGLMLYGMGTVFIFLSLLVVVLKVMSGVIVRHFSAVADQPMESKPGTSDSQVPVAAISAAVHQYRKSRGLLSHRENKQ